LGEQSWRKGIGEETGEVDRAKHSKTGNFSGKWVLFA